jgi:hypothetical protein
MRKLFTLAIVFAGIVYLQWQQIPMPALPAGAPLKSAPWDLPVARQFDTKQQLATLEGANLWGKTAQEAATLTTPPAEPGWRILGAMLRGSERYVLLQIEGEPERTLTVGESLPGGGRIVEIRDNAVCVLVNNKRRLLAVNSGNMMPLADALVGADEPAAVARRPVRVHKTVRKAKSSAGKATGP